MALPKYKEAINAALAMTPTINESLRSDLISTITIIHYSALDDIMGATLSFMAGESYKSSSIFISTIRELMNIKENHEKAASFNCYVRSWEMLNRNPHLRSHIDAVSTLPPEQVETIVNLTYHTADQYPALCDRSLIKIIAKSDLFHFDDYVRAFVRFLGPDPSEDSCSSYGIGIAIFEALTRINFDKLEAVVDQALAKENILSQTKVLEYTDTITAINDAHAEVSDT